MAQVTSSVPVPGGTVTFLDGANDIGAVAVVNGVAEFDTALLAPGAHSLSAKFQGDTQLGPTVYGIFSPSTSPTVPVTVTVDVTTIVLASLSTSATAGTVVTFSTQVSSTAGSPFGGVSFYDGNNLLGTEALNANDSADFSTASLAIGAHSVTAVFNANGPFGASTSAPVNISITAASTTVVPAFIALTEENNSATGAVNLVAKVLPASPAAGATVTFIDRGLILGTAAVDTTGIARLPQSQMTSGTHALTASFAGNSQMAAAVTPLLAEVWPASGQGFSLAIASLVKQPAAAAIAEFKVSLTAQGQSSGTITLSCTHDLPPGYVCKFSPGLVIGSGDSTLFILPAGASLSALRHSRRDGWMGLMAIFIVSVLLGDWPRRRSRFCLAVCAIAGFIVLAGCTGTSPSNETSRTAVITIQAISGSGSQQIIHSAQVPISFMPEK